MLIYNVPQFLILSKFSNTGSSDMSESISNRLKKNIEPIMKEWESRVLVEIVSANFETPLALRDSLPEYLSQLASALSQKIDRTQARKIFDKSESTRVGKKHGSERSKSVNYTMKEMILEYHILRRVVFDVLEQEAPMTDVEREIIVCSVEQAVNDAASEFSDSLKHVNAELNEEKNLRDKFVASLSHDLRSPLTSIKMLAQLLAKKIHSPEDILKSSNKIVAGVDRIDSMIQDLLDFTHFRVGEKLPFNPGLTHINKIVKSSVDDLNEIYGKRFELVANEQYNVVCDASAITRIIENLGSNAVKYGSKDTPITLKLLAADKYLNISVHNFGKPIDAEDLETIFEPFKRTESAQQGSQKGWGIGLPLIKGLAEAHGGQAMVKSTEDGTTFTVSIPV